MRNKSIRSISVGLALLFSFLTTHAFEAPDKKNLVRDRKAIYVDDLHPRTDQQRAFFYYPDARVYFDPNIREFFWFEGGIWVNGPALPKSIVASDLTRIAFESDAERPQMVDSKVQAAFSGDKRPVPSKLPPPREASLDPRKVLDKESMKIRGTWEEVDWPDTLDLADRADYAMHILTENFDPTCAYSNYAGFRFGQSVYAYGPLWNHVPNYLFTIPYARVMTGSELNIDREYSVMELGLNQISDGMVWWPIDAGEAKNTSCPSWTGAWALCFLNWYERDKNPAWLDWVGSLCKGFDKLAFKVEDRAYFPPEYDITPDGNWVFTLRGKVRGYQFPDEPVNDTQGMEGLVKMMTLCGAGEAMVGYYKRTGDKKALDLTQRLVRFCLRPGFWSGTSEQGFAGSEHGMHYGHGYGSVHSYCAMFDLAMAEGNDWLKQFIREGYAEFAHDALVPRLGYWIGSESCMQAYLAILAVKLSDAGLADLWDDVEAITRNQFAEQQFVDMNQMRKLAGNDPKNDAMLDRFMGGFGVGIEMTAMEPEAAGCCSYSGPKGLYYAWHGITRFERGVAKVNMFLNRVSPWMNVASWLPYEGKVVLTNKQAHTADVRIPGWLDMDDLKCAINGQTVQPARVGRHLIFRLLKAGDTIQLDFAVPETTDRYYDCRIKATRTIQFRGNTVVDIQPRSLDSKLYLMYQREHMKATKAPMHKVKRFVADEAMLLQ